MVLDYGLYSKLLMPFIINVSVLLVLMFATKTNFIYKYEHATVHFSNHTARKKPSFK